MPEKLFQELEFLKKDIDEMTTHVKKMLTMSMDALKNRDKELASEVLQMKTKLYDMDQHIEEHVLKVLTLYQPVAKDMRNLACLLKMITYLTRIGRYGYDIAKITLDIGDQPHVKKLIDIPRMSEVVISMVDDVVKAYFNDDPDLIKDFEERDDFLDEERYSIFRECLTYMMEDPRTITRCTHYIMIARYLERCGDHACKIAEKVNYKITGKWVEIS